MALDARFDVFFTQKTGFATLNRLLGRLYRNKAELLDLSQIPLHTNGSGRQNRDTFSNLRKTV